MGEFVGVCSTLAIALLRLESNVLQVHVVGPSDWTAEIMGILIDVMLATAITLLRLMVLELSILFSLFNI